MTIPVMNFARALDLTLKQFKISGKEIAAQSGVAESSISRYRRGERDIQADSLERIITVLPTHAKYHFYLNCLVTDLDDHGIAMLLQAISIKIRENSENSPLPEKVVALT